jgi:2-isopropylmalate synthase
MQVQRNKAIVGANAFAHEAGVHQDGILKERTTYEIMRPQDIGIEGSELVLGKHSGRHAFQHHMSRLGFVLKPDEVEKAYVRFIELADKKKNIYDDDLLMIAREQMTDAPAMCVLDYLSVSTGTTTVPTATVRIRKGNEIIQDAACGDGPVDATLKTIDRMTGVRGKLTDFSLQAVTVGKDAVGEVSMRVEFSGHGAISSKASSTDIVEASAKAYLSCVNQHLSIKDFAAQAGKAGPKAAPRRRRKGRRSA